MCPYCNSEKNKCEEIKCHFNISGVCNYLSYKTYDEMDCYEPECESCSCKNNDDV